MKDALSFVAVSLVGILAVLGVTAALAIALAGGLDEALMLVAILGVTV